MADYFTSDINALHIIGRMDLPLMGLTYARLNNAVADTATGEQAAFQEAPGGPPARIAGLWRIVRDDLQNILGQSTENLHAAAATMVHIAETYEQTDTDSGKAILATDWGPGGSPSGTIDGERIPDEAQPPVRIAG
ncbi:hypothetical protein [Actinoplanes couchii]|uniref:Uncharacterized protein n=1 Tax=Actinoplanes couchii TaxID=403638 RepID=A0ABQ3X8T6_9ACTN|nr:hypothetical protein [Actinoplanes couchii]MDR6325923.1 hypothetical protein [Actinoplanes couchii]GID54907.1 hypothetical protein Aco03nite_033110 [Actinoplanes couchii]